jgi:hypothetical protein
MEHFEAELWVIGLEVEEMIEMTAILQCNWVNMVAVSSHSHHAIRRAAHLELGPGQELARRIDRKAHPLLTRCIKTVIHWVPGYSCIPKNEEADR